MKTTRKLLVEREIREVEEGLRRAYVANDLPAYFNYFAADSTVMTPEGLVDHPSYLASWTNYVHCGNRVVSLEYSDMRVRVGPGENTAVASFGVRVQIQMADGGLTDERYLETDVWFRVASAWRLVHAQYVKRADSADRR